MSAHLAADRQPFNVRCGDCQHLPMELTAAAKVLGSAHCPNCGAGPSKQLVGGSADDALTINTELSDE